MLRRNALASIPPSPQPKSKSSAFSPSGCGISFRPPWAFMRSCPRASGTLNQRQKHPRARPMPRETIRRTSRDGRPAHRQHPALGPPRETSAHATPCRKTPYARRKTRTPRPGGQGVHSEPAGAPVSRAPLEVVRAKRVSNSRIGFRFPKGARYPSSASETGFRIAWSEPDRSQCPTPQRPPPRRPALDIFTCGVTIAMRDYWIRRPSHEGSLRPGAGEGTVRRDPACRAPQAPDHRCSRQHR